MGGFPSRPASVGRWGEVVVEENVKFGGALNER